MTLSLSINKVVCDMDESKYTQGAKLIPLSGMPEWTHGRIGELKGGKGLCRQLREMGIKERADIRVVRRGSNYVCLVEGFRIALGSQFVSCIWVSQGEQ